MTKAGFALKIAINQLINQPTNQPSISMYNYQSIYLDIFILIRWKSPYKKQFNSRLGVSSWCNG